METLNCVFNINCLLRTTGCLVVGEVEGGRAGVGEGGGAGEGARAGAMPNFLQGKGKHERHKRQVRQRV